MDAAAWSLWADAADAAWADDARGRLCAGAERCALADDLGAFEASPQDTVLSAPEPGDALLASFASGYGHLGLGTATFSEPPSPRLEAPLAAPASPAGAVLACACASPIAFPRGQLAASASFGEERSDLESRAFFPHLWPGLDADAAADVSASFAETTSVGDLLPLSPPPAALDDESEVRPGSPESLGSPPARLSPLSVAPRPVRVTRQTLKAAETAVRPEPAREVAKPQVRVQVEAQAQARAQPQPQPQVRKQPKPEPEPEPEPEPATSRRLGGPGRPPQHGLEMRVNAEGRVEYLCPQCDVTRMKADSVKRHMQVVHRGSRGDYPCPKKGCGGHFIDPDHLRRHLATHRAHPGKMWCGSSRCPVWVATAEELEEHRAECWSRVRISTSAMIRVPSSSSAGSRSSIRRAASKRPRVDDSDDETEDDSDSDSDFTSRSCRRVAGRKRVRV